ncbi:MAG TPA: GntR family transcriptional regulator [Thermodesulfobacteriota bacterium]|nr:GntR family transcriptional regulator [Thermodesulfobacteriota bacterium]
MRRLIIKNTKSIRQKIYFHLREQLLNGEIPPHQHLVETKIAKEVGISRTPIREALHSLELEGLIESIPRVGYVVKPIDEDEVGEICEIRAAIEGVGARWAMEKAPQKLIDDLKQNISTSEEIVAQGDPKAFVELDAQFHEIIARLSGSRRLQELGQTLRRHMLRYRVQSIYLTENVLRAIKGHKGILEAIEKGQWEEVARAIRYHLEQSKKDILRYAFKEATKTEESSEGS